MMKKLLTATLGLLTVGFVGGAMAAGTYYEFSTYGGSGSELDVASYGNTIYYGAGAAVHSIDVSIADLTKVDEPYFLADGVTPNPNYQTRTFSNPQSINLTGSPSLNGGSVGELYVDATHIYTTGGSNGNQVYAFDKATGAYTGQVVTNTASAPRASHLGFGGGKWWMSNESRQVFSSTGGDWTYEFTWNNMAGSHGDGMEWVNGHIFVSDMTSNHIAMWDEADGVWSETERFDYQELSGGNKYVEGMGFGALGHFWAGSGSLVYELGGGSIGDYTGVPEPGMLLLMGTGLLGLFGLRRRIS